MLKGWLIYSREDAKSNHTYIDWFINEAKRKDIELTFIARETMTICIKRQELHVLINGNQSILPDFAVVRVVEPLLNTHLENCGVKTFNSAYISHICNHKSYTYEQISQLGIPIVDTIFPYSIKNLTQVPLPYPFVIKDAWGRGGKSVFYIKDEKEWQDFDSSQVESPIIQSADVQLGRDIRVFVVGKSIISAVLRQNDSDFRANIKQGGIALWYELSPIEKELIQKIIDHFDFGMVGIDFLLSHENTLIFNEIEDIVGSRSLSMVSDINILEHYLAYIKKNIS